MALRKRERQQQLEAFAAFQRIAAVSRPSALHRAVRWPGFWGPRASSPNRAKSVAHEILEVSCEWGFLFASQQTAVASPSGATPVAIQPRHITHHCVLFPIRHQHPTTRNPSSVNHFRPPRHHRPFHDILQSPQLRGTREILVLPWGRDALCGILELWPIVYLSPATGALNDRNSLHSRYSARRSVVDRLG